MYTLTHTRICTYASACTHTDVHACAYKYADMHLYLCSHSRILDVETQWYYVYILTHMHMYIYIYTHTRMHIYTYIHIYIYMYIYIYIYIYIYEYIERETSMYIQLYALD